MADGVWHIAERSTLVRVPGSVAPADVRLAICDRSIAQPDAIGYTPYANL
jgi:hypothetical protein